MKKKLGRPPGRRNSIRYREGVAREVLTLRIPSDATPEVKALGDEARAVIAKALRSTDPLAFCRPRVLAAMYVLRNEIARPTTLVDLLDDMK